MKKGIYEANGILMSKASPKVGDQMEITYSGLLMTSGAQHVRIHLGYNEAWENAEYIDMTADAEGFKAVITLGQPGTFNFAFLDPAGNWDNNSGNNYSVEVKTSKKAKKESDQPGETGESEVKSKKVSAKKGKKTEAEKTTADGKTVKKAKKKFKSDESEASGTLDAESKKDKSSKKVKAKSEASAEQKAKKGPGRPKKSA